jgi:hypothetical protein
MAVWAPFLAGQRVTADDLNTLLVREVMEWTPLANLGAFQTNFTANTTRVPKMRKIMVLGTLIWEFKGTINCTSFTANTIFNAFKFTNSTEWVTSERELQQSGSSSAHYGVRFGFQTTGFVTASVPTSALSAMTNFWIDGRVVDPMLAA